MKIHSYHPATGEYIGTTEADESPLEPGVFLIPAQATDVAPPARREQSARVFVDGNWNFVADHRGEKWFRKHGDPVIIDALGSPEGLTPTEPPAPPPPPPPPVTVVKKAYFMAALSRSAKLGQVKQAVSSISEEKQQLWEYANELSINDPDIITIAAALDLNLRTLFDLAETIRTKR